MKKLATMVTVVALCGFPMLGLSATTKAQTFNCKGLDSNSTVINSVLTITPSDKPGTYKSVWVYDNTSLGTDKGVLNTIGKNRMEEEYKSHDGVHVGKSMLYQIDDNQIVVSFDNLNTKTNVKITGLGICQPA